MSILVSLVAVALGQVVKGVVGFGSALVAVPVLTLVWGPVDGIFIAALCDIFSECVLLPAVWRNLRLLLVLAAVVPLISLQFLATGVLAEMPVDTFRVALGVLLVIFGADMALRPVRLGSGQLEDLPDQARGRLYGAAAGAGLLGGVLSGLFATPGPPLVVMMRHFFAPAFSRAHLLAIFAPCSLTLAASLWWRGTSAPAAELAVVSLILAPAVIVGGLVGSRLSGRISVATSGRIVGAVLAAAGAMLMMTG